MTGVTSGQRGIGGDVLKLAGGTAFSQILGILAAPILTRIYGPECFGAAAVFASIIGILTVVSCFRYELAVLLPGNDAEAVNVLGVSLTGTVLTALMAGVVFMTAGHFIAGHLKVPELEAYLWLVAPMVFLSGTFQALNYWNSRTRLYGRLAVARTMQSIATNGTQIGLGFVGAICAGGLIWGIVFGTAVVTAILSLHIWKDDAALFRANLRLRAMSAAMKLYRKFPLIDLWGSLLNVVSQHMPVLLLSLYFSQGTVGQYSVASRLIYLPMTLVGGAIGQVFFQRSAEAHARQDDLAALTGNVFKRLVSLALLPSLLLIITGKEVFELVFGPAWAEAGWYVQILSPWMFVWFVASPLTALFAVTQRLESAFFVHILILVTRVAPLVIGGVYGDVYLTLVLFSLSGVVAYGIVGIWSIKLAGVAWREPAIIIGKIALRSTPAFAIVLVLDVMLDASSWVVVLAAAIGLLEYTWHVVRTDTEISVYMNSALGIRHKRR